MQIYQCDRCGLVVQDYHNMWKIGWRPYARSDSFEEAFDNDRSPRFGEMEICNQCFGLFKTWMGIQPEEEPFEKE